LGLLLQEIGYKNKALRFHEICLNIDKTFGQSDRIANDLCNIGYCTNDEKYLDEELQYRLQAVNYFSNQGKRKEEEKEYHNISYIYFKKNDYANAEKYINMSFEISLKENYKKDMVLSLTNLISILLKARKFKDAKNKSEESLKYYDKNDFRSFAVTYSNLSIIFCELNDPDKALEYAQKAFDIDNKQNNIRGKIRDYRNMVKAYYNKNNLQKYHEYLEKVRIEIENFEKETNTVYTDYDYTDFVNN
jgi:tetratricopeptide (TPR) repeat protein